MRPFLPFIVQEEWRSTCVAMILSGGMGCGMVLCGDGEVLHFWSCSDRRHSMVASIVVASHSLCCIHDTWPCPYRLEPYSCQAEACFVPRLAPKASSSNLCTEILMGFVAIVLGI